MSSITRVVNSTIKGTHTAYTSTFSSAEFPLTDTVYLRSWTVRVTVKTYHILRNMLVDLSFTKVEQRHKYIPIKRDGGSLPVCSDSFSGGSEITSSNSRYFGSKRSRLISWPFVNVHAFDIGAPNCKAQTM